MPKAEGRFEGQLPNEEVLMLFRKHPIVMRKGLIVASIGILVGPLFTTLLTTEFGMKLFHMSDLPSMNFFFGALGLSFLLAAILFFPSWMSWYFSVYILTNERFIQIKQKGFFEKNVVDIGLDNISMINYEVKGFQETLLGFGTITMQTYVGELVIHEVHHPGKLQAELNSRLRKMGFMKQNQAPFMEKADNNE
ncbi:PH domain-containing protein [Candidatus Saccharibacteria bacterium]|nr:PH domain-containing protein [Candidatus Saccharibacteria bacterium]